MSDVAMGVFMVGGAVVALGALVMVWALCAAAGMSDQRAHDAEVLAELAAERVRVEMRDRMLHARLRQVRDGRDDAE